MKGHMFLSKWPFGSTTLSMALSRPAVLSLSVEHVVHYHCKYMSEILTLHSNNHPLPLVSHRIHQRRRKNTCVCVKGRPNTVMCQNDF